MIAFWIATALLSAACAGLVFHRASRAAARVAGQDEDPTLGVYRRQLAEVEDLASQGLLTEAEFRSTRTEAARRLLSAAEAVPPQTAARSNGRRLVLGLAIAAPLATLAVYLFVGPFLHITAPGDRDEPFVRRLAAWRQANPASLDAPRMVAVLQQVVSERPRDPEALSYLAQAEANTGDFYSAERSLQKALNLAPRRADLWALYGQMLVSESTGQAVPDEARHAFQTALSLDAKALAPRYFMAQIRIASGDVAGGLADWKALRADMPPGDPRAQGLDQEIAVVERTHALPPPSSAGGEEAQAGPGADGQGGDPKAFIQAMVGRLAARLAAQPNDPQGWARLVRSYHVLGDQTAMEAALGRARALFKDRPADLAPIEAAAR